MKEVDENGNTFISPTSLLMALSMVYNGADGSTKEEIAKALQVEGIEVEELNEVNASLITSTKGFKENPTRHRKFNLVECQLSVPRGLR